MGLIFIKNLQMYEERGKLIMYGISYTQLNLIKDIDQNQIHMMLHGLRDILCQLG